MEDLIRRIIKEEISNRGKEKLNKMIKEFGIIKTLKVVGNMDNLFKVLVINSPMDFLHLFDGLEQVQSEENSNFVLFRYKPKHNFIVYDRKNEEVYINYDDIWSVLENNFGLDYSEIEGLTKEWLGEVYNLRGVTTSPQTSVSLFPSWMVFLI
jgi:hypothetical protein